MWHYVAIVVVIVIVLLFIWHRTETFDVKIATYINPRGIAEIKDAVNIRDLFLVDVISITGLGRYHLLSSSSNTTNVFIMAPDFMKDKNTFYVGVVAPNNKYIHVYDSLINPIVGAANGELVTGNLIKRWRFTSTYAMNSIIPKALRDIAPKNVQNLTDISKIKVLDIRGGLNRVSCDIYRTAYGPNNTTKKVTMRCMLWESKYKNIFFGMSDNSMLLIVVILNNKLYVLNNDGKILRGSYGGFQFGDVIPKAANMSVENVVKLAQPAPPPQITPRVA